MSVPEIRSLENGNWRVGQLILYRRGVHWHYYTKRGDGQRQRGALHTADFDDAVAQALTINKGLEKGQRLPSSGIRLIRLIDEFRTSYAGWSETTHKSCAGFGKRLLGEFGNRLIGDLTAQDVDRWLNRAMKEGFYRRKPGGTLYKMTPSSRNRYVAYIRRLYACAEEWGWLQENPMLALKQIREQQKIPEALTSEEMERLLEHLTEPARSIVLLAADTGIRREALFGLTWDVVDLRRRVIRLDRTKDKKSRLVPMTERVHKLLRVLQQANKASDTPSLHILPKYDIRAPLAKAAAKAGLGHVHFHMFRHTCATRLLESGADIRYVQKILGHASIEMTARYAHVRVEKLHEVFRGLEAHEGGQ